MRRLLALVLAALLLTGCTPGPEGGERPQAEVVLNYYTIGEPDRDLVLVNDALNEILTEKYGFAVNYRKIGWNEYDNYLTAMLNTNQPFDIAFTWTDDYEANALAGAWLT